MRKHVDRASLPSALAAGVLLAAVASAQLRFPLPPLRQELVAISGFLCLLVAIAACLGVRLLDLRCDAPQVLALLATCAGLLAVSRAGLVGTHETPFALLGVIGYAAWIEELVFRRLLPRAFAQGFEPGNPGAAPACIVASQALFAVSHFLPGLQNQGAIGFTALMRLFAGGLVLAVVVSRAGLAIGALMHAELNLRAILPQPPPQTPSSIGVCLIGLMAIGIIVLKPFALSCAQSLSRGTPNEKSNCGRARLQHHAAGSLRSGAV
jgi:hypothetical protein